MGSGARAYSLRSDQEPSIYFNQDEAGTLLDDLLSPLLSCCMPLTENFCETGLNIIPPFGYDENYSTDTWTDPVQYAGSFPAGTYALPALCNAVELHSLTTTPINFDEASHQVGQLQSTAFPNSLYAEAATHSTYAGDLPVPTDTFQEDACRPSHAAQRPTPLVREIRNVVAIPRNPPSVNASQPRSNDGRIWCKVSGCTSSFSRLSDLHRHQRGKHSGPRRCCPISGCKIRHYRRDKLKAHLLEGHKLNASEADALCTAWEREASGSPSAGIRH